MSDDDGIILDSSVDDMFTMESCTLDGYDEIGTRDNDNNLKYASFNGITEDKCKMDETMITTEITEVTITTTKTKTPKVTTIPDNYNDTNLKKNPQTTNGIVGHNRHYLENRNRDDEGNTQCRMDDDEYDYEDDDDDGINITIASPTIPSLMDVRLNNNTNALTELEISNDVISKPTTTTITSTTMDENEENNNLTKVLDQADFNAENIIEDIGIREELNRLVTNSIILPTLKCITVKYNNQIILISSSTPISSRLASIFWVYPKIYVKQQMPFLNEFNKIIANSTYTPEMMTAHDKYGNEIYRSCKYAVFSVKYKKNFVTNARANDTTKAPDSGNIDSNIIKPDGFKKSNTGIYHYLDFAAVIIENGKIIDYAIHGFVSNIAEMIHIHKPSRVYYNARRGDALDVFMNYQYQPFYESCYGKLTPTIINRTNDFFNPLAFCERQDIYCALCNCLRDVRGLLFKLPEQISIVNNNNYTKQSTTPTEYVPHTDNNNTADYNSQQYTYNEYQYQPYYQLEQQYPTDYYYYPQIQQYNPTYPTYYESTTTTNVMPIQSYSSIPINSYSTEESSIKTPAKELTPIPASSPTPSLTSSSSSSSSSSTNTIRSSVRKSEHSNYNTQRYSNAKDRQNYKYTPSKKHERFIDKQQQQQYRRRYNSQTSTRPQYQHHQPQQKHYHNYNQNHDTHYEQQQPQNRSRQMIDRYKYYLDKYRHHQFYYANNPFRRINPIGKNHLMQPDYNTQKRRIQYALKKPGAFNGFRNERRNLDSKYYS